MSYSRLRLSALLPLLGPAALHAGTSIFSVEKQAVYFQTSSATPTLGGVPSIPEYSGSIQATEAATVTPPGLAATAVPYNANNQAYSLNGLFSTKSAFDAAYPDGTYQITSSGNPTISISLPSDLYPPTVPQVVGGNWQNNVLVLNSAVDNTLQFPSFSTYASTSGGQVAGLMTLKVQSMTGNDNINLKQQYATVGVGGSTQSATPFTTYLIPARTLTPGLIYQATLEFDTVATLNTTVVPGVPVAGIFGNYTEFYIAAQASSQPAAPVITQQPVNASGPLGSSVSFSANYTPASGNNSTPTQSVWAFEGQPLNIDGVKYITSQNGTTLTITNLATADVGAYSVQVYNSAGLAISNPATLSIGAATGAPVILTQPNSIGNSITINGSASGTTVALTVGASNATSYQWKLNGQNVSQGNAAGATGPTLLLTGASNLNAGTYTCVVSNANSSVTSNGVQLNTVLNPSSPGRLGNLSVLTQAGNGSKPLTVGFEVGGAGTSGTQTLLIRGDGPLLAAAPFSKSGTLASPVIDLFASGSSTVLAANSGWSANQAAVTTAEANTYAYPLATGSLDAAMVNILAPGAYSVQVTGNPNGTAAGLALAEVYDDTTSGTYTLATPRLINLSCLAQVNAGGANNLTAGFVIGGTTAKTVLIRAWGPALTPAPFSIAGAMPDPELQVYNTTSGDVLLASNAGWGGNAQIVAAGNLVYDYAWSNANSADSAVLITLPPGNYTAQASSVSGTAGTTLVEVFEVP
jgi:hypothetical protein